MSSNKLRTSRVHAAYILFGKPHTRENEEECPLKLDNIGHGLTLCHYENPERPVLVTYIYLNKQSSHYTEYPIENNLGVSRDDSSREPSSEYKQLCKLYLSLLIVSNATKIEIGISLASLTQHLGTDHPTRKVYGRTGLKR
ncbi:hypothetical protein G6F62_009700 [Rhizopus arrhizus]|nr:hypothetical protein G6F62_009700 [Rhizopus arrhizus]